MITNPSWGRTLRTILVAVLWIALLGAVLGSIGTRDHLGKWAKAPDAVEKPAAHTPSGMSYVVGGAAGRH
jgi:hypothetical protein